MLRGTYSQPGLACDLSTWQLLGLCALTCHTGEGCLEPVTLHQPWTGLKSLGLTMLCVVCVFSHQGCTNYHFKNQLITLTCIFSVTDLFRLLDWLFRPVPMHPPGRQPCLRGSFLVYTGTDHGEGKGMAFSTRSVQRLGCASCRGFSPYF